MLLLLVSLLLTGLSCLLGAPAGREVYRMPQSALKGRFVLLLSFVYLMQVDLPRAVQVDRCY